MGDEELFLFLFSTQRLGLGLGDDATRRPTTHAYACVCGTRLSRVVVGKLSSMRNKVSCVVRMRRSTRRRRRFIGLWFLRMVTSRFETS